jgi:hypothetical protein
MFGDTRESHHLLSVPFVELKKMLGIRKSTTHREKTRMDTKKKVLAIISKSANPFCVSCGCDDMRLLEVNHKNGGGGKEMGKGIANKSMTFYRDITMLRRKTDDLEVLCRVCNAKHYLELKYGKLPIKVTWEGDNGL